MSGEHSVLHYRQLIGGGQGTPAAKCRCGWESTDPEEIAAHAALVESDS